MMSNMAKKDACYLSTSLKYWCMLMLTTRYYIFHDSRPTIQSNSVCTQNSIPSYTGQKMQRFCKDALTDFFFFFGGVLFQHIPKLSRLYCVWCFGEWPLTPTFILWRQPSRMNEPKFPETLWLMVEQLFKFVLRI